MKIKVATYNVQSGRTHEAIPRRNYDFALEVIRSFAPDILGLNEVGKHASYGFPVIEMEGEPTDYLGKKLGMYAYFAKAIDVGGHGYGNGLLSKYPIVSAKTVYIPDAENKDEKFANYYETRCILVAELDVNGQTITVLVSHFGLMDEEKNNAVKAVLSLLDSIRTPVIFMGDLNMLADDEKLTPLFDALCDTANRAKEPITWPSDVTRAKLSLENVTGDALKRKIDYMFTSGHFKTEKIDTIQSTASDHLPYIAHLDLT